MKFIMLMVLALTSSMAFARNVNDFNKVLIDDVRKDITTDNDQALKKDKNAPMRGPASVEETGNTKQIIHNETEIKKNDRQLGNHKW